MELSITPTSQKLQQRLQFRSFWSSLQIPSYNSNFGSYLRKKHRPHTLKCYCGQQTKKTAIQRIIEKLRSQGYVDEVEEEVELKLKLGPGSAGEIFIPSPKDVLVEKSVGHTLEMDIENSCQYQIMRSGGGEGEVKQDKRGREILPTLAEIKVPLEERKRLITLGIRADSKLKIGKAGVSDGIVDSIHQRWRNSEVVKIRCDDLSRTNMRRTHHLLEMKTGGIVVWRSGSTIILYRGTNYEHPYVKAARSLGIALKPKGEMKHAVDRDSLNTAAGRVDAAVSVDASEKGNGSEIVNGNHLTGSFMNSDIALHEKDYVPLPGRTQYEREIDSLLDGLGPRFTDWWGSDPSPVDADLLPGIIYGYKKPFRLLPHGMKLKLTDYEMTRLRRLARPLPPHFALGIKKDLQGLAFSMVKLWECSEIAKIVVKQGVQNTDSEKMAKDLKRLTGGSLLSRDRDFIVFYRGKDFVPFSVAAILEERKAMEKTLNKMEESETVSPIPSDGVMSASDLDILVQFSETREQWIHSEEQRKIEEAVSRAKQIAAARRLDSNLKNALAKKAEVEKELADTEKALNPTESSSGKEMITEEERFMLRKLGLRMKPFLMLGRRGVFDGVVENMHLHWKYRELVKIISKEKSVEHVNYTARTLAYESGGILVGVERVSKGHAILVYRGKNYRRPTLLRPKSLMTKNAALKRSIDIQRRQSLDCHILRLERNIEQLESHLSKVEEERKDTSKLLMEKLDPTYPTEKEDETGIQSTENSKDDVKHVNNCDGNNEKSKDDVKHVNNCDGNNEKVDGWSELQTGKNAAELDNTRTGSGDHKNLKNKMPENMYRARPLSNKQRLILRRQALQMEKRAQFHVGKSNVLSGLAKSIRSYFEKHALVIVGVKGRARGTSIQEIVVQLEEATGGVFVSQEPAKIILYRGWPEGEEKPSYHNKEELQDVNVSRALVTAIRKECGLHVDHSNNIWNDVKQTVHANKRYLNINEDHDHALNSQDNK